MVKTLTDVGQIQAYLLKYFNLSPVTYKVNPDYSIDVFIGCACDSPHLKFLQVKFREIKGSFDINVPNLQSLQNFPQVVSRDWTITRGKFSNLDHAPKSVLGSIVIKNCPNLTHLSGFPQHAERGIFLENLAIENQELRYLPRHVKGSLYIQDCFNLTNLKGLPSQIDGSLDLRKSRISSLEGFENCEGQIVLDYRPELPLLRCLLSKNGVHLVNRGGYTVGGMVLDVKTLSRIINKYQGQGKRMLLHAALEMKKEGQQWLQQTGEDPFKLNATW